MYISYPAVIYDNHINFTFIAVYLCLVHHGNNHGRSSVFQNVNVSDRLIPEEYHMVKNKGLRSLEFFEEWVCFLT